MPNSVSRTVREVMTAEPMIVRSRRTLTEAAQLMRDWDIGELIVTDGEEPQGIITDRDITVRAVASGQDVRITTVGDICSTDIATVGPDDLAEVAIELMTSRAVRRLPVVLDGRIIGVVSIGDLAIDREPDSVLADISLAEPSH